MKRRNRIVSLVLIVLLTAISISGSYVTEAEIAPTAGLTASPTSGLTTATAPEQTGVSTGVSTANPSKDPTSTPAEEPTPDSTGGAATESSQTPSANPTTDSTNNQTGESITENTIDTATEPVTGPLAAEWASLPRYAVVGRSFTYEIAVTGGHEPYTYSRIDSEGVATPITDFGLTPQSAGTYSFRVRVTDADGEAVELSASIPVSDGKREKAQDWEVALKKLNLTGSWAGDLISVAYTQLGYHESETNYIISEDGKRQGYTRYGDWAGMPYEEWCAMFVSFCLHYAGIEKTDFPRSASCINWKNTLGDLYIDNEDAFTPQPGDLVFFHHEREGAPDDANYPNHVGIVAWVSGTTLHTIEGNSSKSVREREYELSDDSIVGYANLRLAEERAKARHESNFAPVLEPVVTPVQTSIPENQNISNPEDSTPQADVAMLLKLRGATLEDTVNVRTQPSTVSEIVAFIPNAGTEIDVYSAYINTERETWFKVAYQGVVGYVRGDLMQVWENESSALSETPDAQTDASETTDETQSEDKVYPSYVRSSTPIADETPAPALPLAQPENVDPSLEPTEGPEVTEEPIETANPEATEEPVETVDPEATEVPMETLDPEATEEPAETLDPEATEEPADAPAEDLPEPILRARTIVDSVDLRPEPSMDNEMLTLIVMVGTELDVLAEVDVDGTLWYMVAYEDMAGYVLAEYLQTWSLEERIDPPMPGFKQSVTVDGVTVTVSAGEGVFPDEAFLSVNRVPVFAREEVDAAVEEVREGDVNVAVSYTFDIKILDAYGEEIDFSAEEGVQVYFAMAEVADANLDTRVYHVAEENGALAASELDVAAAGDTVLVTTDSFSYYTVEFTYGNLQYVMQGDSVIPLSEILEFVGLCGEVQAVEVSNEELFSASDAIDEWMITSHQPFTTTEWMKVTIEGITYEIVVTDQAGINTSVPSGVTAGGDAHTFASNLPLTRVYIDTDMMDEIDNGDGPEFDKTDSSVTETNKVAYYTGSFPKPIDGDDVEDYVSVPGTITYTYKGAAVITDDDGNETRADVVFTYTNVKIYPPYSLAGPRNSRIQYTGSYTGSVSIAAGRNISTGRFMGLKSDSNPAGLPNGWYYGLEVEANISVVGTDTSYPMNFSMLGINVERAGNYRYIYGANMYDTFREQVEVIGGNTSDLLIPNLAIYETKVIQSPITGNVWFIGYGADDATNNTYTNGFLTTMDSADGIDIIFRGSGGIDSSGQLQPMNNKIYPGVSKAYRIRSTSGAGGDIQTTENGNPDGSLTHGEGNALLGKGTYVVPEGKTVVYTMTPESGYRIKAVKIADSTGDNYHKTWDNDELLDMEDGETKTVQLSSNRTGILTRVGNTFTFKFQENNNDHHIHVDWEPLVDYKITKQVSGNMASRSRYFKFDIDVDLSNSVIDTVAYPSSWTFNLDDPTPDTGTFEENYPATAYGDGGTNDKTITVNTGDGEKTGSATVWLRHGQNVTIKGLPDQAKVTVREAKPDGYTTTNTHGAAEVATQIMQANAGGANNTFNNNFQTEVPTGIFDDITPARWMLLVGALLAAVVLLTRRRGDADA